MTILIVGAGAAGLAAAFTLVNSGITNFTILEASSTLGGRLKKTTDLASYPIDLGALWIHRSPRVLETISGNPNILDGIDTVLHVPPEIRTWNGPDIGFGPNLMDSLEPTAANGFTEYLFVNYTWFDFFNDTIAVPRVRDNIVFDCPVTTIDYSDDNSNDTVTAICEDGTVYTGSHIIVTVPLSILQQQEEMITFRPPLPDAYIQAIMDIPMPAGFKVFLRFRQMSYPSAFYLSQQFDPAQLYFWDESYGESTNATEHVLGVFVSDTAAADLSSLQDDELLASIMDVLDRVFVGNATEHFVRAEVQNWSKEPYIRTTYSHYDNTWRQIDLLKVPLNGGSDNRPVLFFAGEALPADGTDYNNGYADGAALSGMEAAGKVIELLMSENEGGGTSAASVINMSAWSFRLLLTAVVAYQLFS